jgi:hypothetical protein
MGLIFSSNQDLSGFAFSPKASLPYFRMPGGRFDVGEPRGGTPQRGDEANSMPDVRTLIATSKI